MRKQIWLILMITVLVSTCMLCACDGDGNVCSEHVGGEWIVDREATCTEQGAKHRVCTNDGCGAVLEETVIPALGHDYVNHVCTRCDDHYTSVGLEYEEIRTDDDEKAYTVKGLGSCTDTDIVIPDTLPDGLPVVRIENSAFENCTTMESIVLPKSVTVIPYDAFKGCSNLKSIVIPDDVWYIAKGAFSGCVSLESITVPFIGGENTDEYHWNNDSINYFGYIFGASSRAENSAYVPTSLKKVVVTGGTYVTYEAFVDCSAIETILLPESVTAIYRSAFKGCTGLSRISVPSGLTELGDDVFSDCVGLSYQEYGNALYLGDDENPYTILMKAKSTGIDSCDTHADTKFIYSNAFENCANMIRFSAPAGIIGSGIDVFTGCTALESATVSFELIDDLPAEQIKELTINELSDLSPHQGVLREYTSIERLTLPEIGNTAYDRDYSLGTFFGNTYDWSDNPEYVPTSLKEVTITGGDFIYPGAFYKCENIERITLPDTLTCIRENAFTDCAGLTSLVIPEGVTRIESQALYGCVNLESLSLPDSLTYIGFEAFDACENLAYSYTEYNYAYYLGNDKNPYVVLYQAFSVPSITIHEDTKLIASYAFEDTVIESIVIPDGVVGIGVYAFSYCYSLQTVYIGQNGNLTYIDTNAFLYCTALESIMLPDGIEYIGKQGFVGDSFLEGCPKLTLNEYENAYYLGNEENPYLVLVGAKSKDITSCTIHEATRVICETAFMDCTRLETIVIPDSVKHIHKKAFYNCKSLYNLTIGSGVTHIKESTFEACTSMTTVTISNSVKTIENMAFSTYNTIEVVYYGGTESDWNEMSIDRNNNRLLNAARYYFSETEPTTDGNYWHYDADGNPAAW